MMCAIVVFRISSRSADWRAAGARCAEHGDCAVWRRHRAGLSGGGVLMKRKAPSGAAIVEMALVTPILVMLLVGIVDFGRVWNAYEVVTNAAREAARIA